MQPPIQQHESQESGLGLHSSSSAVSSSAYPGAFSSSSAAAAAAQQIKWVDRSNDSNFKSPIWSLGLLLCSENKINGHFLVKCAVCEQHRSSWKKFDDGKKTFTDHAERYHPKEPKVAAWLHNRAVQEEEMQHERAAEEGKVVQVGVSFWLACCLLI